MIYESSKLLGLVFVFFLAIFFGSYESGFTSPPPKYFISCNRVSVDIYGQTEALSQIIYCGSDKTGCKCPDGWKEGGSLTITYTKKLHRAASPPFKTLNHDKAKRILHPKAEAEPTYSFTHTLEGEWEDVVGYVGFQYTDKNTQKDYIACLIGLYVKPLGNNEYQSEPWDKKIFWIDVGDGAPMHVCAVFAPNYEEDGVEYDNVYWAPNFMYLPPGETDTNKMRSCDMWMYLDEDDEVEEVWIDIYDENWEITKTKELGIGDQIQAFTPLIDPSEPASFLGITMEDRFRTVKTPPVFLYEHMTPNVDFENEMSKGFDFDDADLLYILYAENYDEEDVSQFTYSTPKKVGIKWGDKPSKAENWFQYGISGILNFFLSAR